MYIQINFLMPAVDRQLAHVSYIHRSYHIRLYVRRCVVYRLKNVDGYIRTFIHRSIDAYVYSLQHSKV